MLKIEHLRKVYPNGVVALNDVNFSVEDGEFLAIIGLADPVNPPFYGVLIV